MAEQFNGIDGKFADFHSLEWCLLSLRFAIVTFSFVQIFENLREIASYIEMCVFVILINHHHRYHIHHYYFIFHNLHCVTMESNRS